MKTLRVYATSLHSVNTMNCLLSTGRAWRGWTCRTLWICWTPCKLHSIALQYTQTLYLRTISRISLHKSADRKIHEHTQFSGYLPYLFTLPFCRALMVRPDQEASVDLPEEREKLAPPALLDLLDSLDLLLVPFTLETHLLYYRADQI